MNQQFHDFDHSFQNNSGGLTVGKYTAKTFAWMCLGLMITFLSALFLAVSGLAIVVLTTPGISMVLAVVQIGVVIFLSARINKMSVTAAKGLFISYSFLTGITFSSLFYAYGFGNVIGVFLLTSLYFGALSAFGYYTTVDLSKLGPLFMGGLVFLVIAGIVLMFANIPMLDTLVCLVGIVLFLAMTAYDVQKIRHHYSMYSHDQGLLAKASVLSALELYLDFINLFIYLLRFLGNRDN